MNMTLLKTALMAGTMLLAGSLAACGGDDRSQDAQAEQPVTSASKPLVEKAPAAAPDAQQSPASAEALTAEGWKKLRIGMAKEAITAAYGPDANPGAVGGSEPDQCEQYRPENAPEGMLLMLVEGKLARISLIRNSAVKTDADLGLGATADAVKTAYGAKALASPHKYEEAPAAYITVWKTDHSGESYVTDETARGVRYVLGGDAKVQSIHAGGPAIQYVEGCS